MEQRKKQGHLTHFPLQRATHIAQIDTPLLPAGMRVQSVPPADYANSQPSRCLFLKQRGGSFAFLGSTIPYNDIHLSHWKQREQQKQSNDT
jgi:hypothetical protein